MSDSTPTAYNSLKDELARTGVISDSFKGLIIAYAANIAQEAHALGRKQERERMGQTLNGDTIRKAFDEDRTVHDVIEAHQALEALEVLCR